MSTEITHAEGRSATRARGRRSRDRATSARRNRPEAFVNERADIPPIGGLARERRRIAAVRDLAVRYQNGTGVAQNLKKAFELFEEAAALGDADALFNVGTYWENGFGVPRKDPAYAAFCYFRAALAGSADGLYALGVCFGEGIGFPHNDRIAAELFANSARRGIPEGAYSLGQCLLHGRGVKRDTKAAFHWLVRAADDGFAPAQFSVGLCYLRGQGVKRDSGIAREFFAQAAKGGDELAIAEMKKWSGSHSAAGNGRH